MKDNGWTESDQPLMCNRFELDIEPFKDISPKEFDILNQLRTSCWKVEGIGTQFITAYFYDNEAIDFYRLLKGCTFRAIFSTYYRPYHSIGRKLDFSVKDKALVTLSPLDWTKSVASSVIVQFELETFEE